MRQGEAQTTPILYVFLDLPLFLTGDIDIDHPTLHSILPGESAGWVDTRADRKSNTESTIVPNDLLAEGLTCPAKS